LTEHTWDGDETALPYAGTQGWSGSDTSQERAETEAADGTASQRQQDTLRYLGWRGDRGTDHAQQVELDQQAELDQMQYSMGLEPSGWQDSY
jgi:hypothetical protein